MESTKKCPSCGEVKAISAFGRNQSLSDGLSFYCLACNRARNNRWYRERRRALGHEVRDHSWVPDGFRWCGGCRQAVSHEDYVRNAGTVSGFGSRCRACDRAANSAGYFYRKYKLTPNAVADMRAAQQDRCAICREPGPEHLDHDHSTGGIRKLLCTRCNMGLGQFRDDPGLLRIAALYVEHHNEQQALAQLGDVSAVESSDISRPGEPPVGSQRRPGAPDTSARSTGRSSGSRRRKTAGEADE